MLQEAVHACKRMDNCACAKKRGNGQEDHFGASNKSALIGVEGDVVGCMVIVMAPLPLK